jgi:hypothetical protein
MKDVAVILAISVGVSLNVIVLGLIWLCWRTIRDRPPDTFEGQPTQTSYPQRDTLS